MIRVSGRFQIVLSSTHRYSGGFIITYEAINADVTTKRRTSLKLKHFVTDSSGIAPNPLKNGSVRFFIGSLQNDGYTGKDGQWVDNGYCVVIDSIIDPTPSPDDKTVVYEYIEGTRRFTDLIIEDGRASR